ncbi:MAG: tRNA (guanosine(37)-N1)-methyltransferase TrmD [Anaerolineae bacterium]|nr:tRNA (guanosine(37)-N1)-methyltransferase TrmD [Anaerolineae bacterium]
MHFDIFTLFPEMFGGALDASILGRAQELGYLSVACHNIRDWAEGKHRITDEPPYGGGGGMVMKVQPVVDAVESVLGDARGAVPVILLTPQGRVFDQRIAEELAQHARLALICGRYEGIDERVRELVVTDEISIGDYVLTGGELPALVLIDAVTRLIPGVLGARWAPEDDSHATGLLEGPHYTRPPVFRDLAVPETLLSGDHARIERWHREQALRRTFERRPDLLKRTKTNLTEQDRQFIERLRAEATDPGREEP